MIWWSWWWKCFLACSQLLSSVCRCWVLTHTNTTMSSWVSFLSWIHGNLSVVLHIRVCFVLAFHIFPALRAVFCFWPRYVVIWSGLATLIAPMGTICTTSIQQTSNMMTNMFLFVCTLYSFKNFSEILPWVPIPWYKWVGEIWSLIVRPSYWVIYCRWTVRTMGTEIYILKRYRC